MKLPEEEVFAKYRTISGGKNPENSPEPSPSPTPSGDDDYVILDKFHEIAFILVSAPMLAMCTKFSKWCLRERWTVLILLNITIVIFLWLFS